MVMAKDSRVDSLAGRDVSTRFNVKLDGGSERFLICSGTASGLILELKSIYGMKRLCTSDED